MFTLELIPYVGLGLLRFGMTPDEINAIIGEPRHRLHKHYENISVRYSISDDPRCDGFYVEPHRHGIDVTFEGQSLLMVTKAEISAWLKGRDPDLLLDDDLIYSPKFGIRYESGDDWNTHEKPHYIDILSPSGKPTRWEEKKERFWKGAKEIVLYAEPFIGAGPIKFGMTEDEVRQVLVEIGINQSSSSDNWEMGFGFEVLSEEDPTPRCVDISAWLPTQFFLLGHELLWTPFRETKRWINEIDPEADVRDDACESFESKKLGIQLWIDPTCPRNPPYWVRFVTPQWWGESE